MSIAFPSRRTTEARASSGGAAVIEKLSMANVCSFKALCSSAAQKGIADIDEKGGSEDPIDLLGSKCLEVFQHRDAEGSCISELGGGVWQSDMRSLQLE
jgi:hypothetical protein